MDRKQMENSRKRKGEELNRGENKNLDKQGKKDGHNQADQPAKPVYGNCGKGHFGECLAGKNACFRCKQIRHLANDCPVFGNTKFAEKKGPGGRARVFNMQLLNRGKSI
ncbi:hypothetical protein PHJA_002427500 [Phtheirospermum japonicum]|uniref:CCHC-type domain-containing protein n=1 Tax=Phtheirospermum japonicum TaxID=374723 RepID=A0A830D6U3_9LAMI|nr:hypothetical protein PHJA_002427500 [Phtheirospermum japonicum]